jgi:hypothetical protein
VRSLTARLSNAAAASAEAPRPDALPHGVAKYYRLLESWEAQPVGSPVHVVLSAGFPDVEGVRRSWAPIAQGGLHLHVVPGDHDSYIRADAAPTARLIESILAGHA